MSIDWVMVWQFFLAAVILVLLYVALDHGHHNDKTRRHE